MRDFNSYTCSLNKRQHRLNNVIFRQFCPYLKAAPVTLFAIKLLQIHKIIAQCYSKTYFTYLTLSLLSPICTSIYMYPVYVLYREKPD